MRKLLSLLTAATLTAQLLVVMGFAAQPASATIPECSPTMATQNGLKVEPGHGKVFYVDTGLNPKLDAGYVAYKVTNSRGSMFSPFVVLDTFTGGNVSLANPLDSSQQIREIANNQAKTAFFLLRSNGGTTTRQSHLVKVYANNPSVDATPLLTCSFTFLRVTETIKANANKIESITHAYSGGSARIGGTITTTVNGKTGTVGAGSAPDFSAFWASPAAFSSWPTRSLRLESTSIFMDCSGGTPNITLTNTLFAVNASDCFGNPSSTWTGTYVFRIVGGAAIAPVPSPVANIASGTKYKHSDTAGIPGNTALTTIQNLTPTGVVVRHSGVVASATSTTINVRYTTTISSTVDVVVDELYDRQISWSGTVNYVANSLTRNGSSIADTNLSNERLSNPPLLRFFGPLTVTAATPLTYTYEKTYQCGNNARTAAFAKIGDTTFGSENYTLASASLVNSRVENNLCVADISSVTEQLDPLVRTDPATTITTTGAALQGFIDPYGVAGSFFRFSYSTDPNMINSVTTGAWQASNTSTPKSVAQTLTGLTSGTTYYYRAELKSSTGQVYQGSILSFNTLSVQAAPTAVTLPATGIAATSATLNGEIDPNLTTVTGVRFVYSISSNMSSPTTTPFITILDEGATVQLTLAGDGTNEVSQAISGLASGTTYFYQVQINCAVDATFCPTGTITGNIQSFTAGAPTVTTEPATNVGATTASISSIVTFGSNVSHRFIYCKAGSTFTGVVSQTSTTCDASTVFDAPTLTNAVTLTNPSSALTTASLSGLDAGARYFFVAVGASAANANLKSFGRVLFFDTLAITTSDPLPGGQTGFAYQQAIAGSGGSGSYVWSVATGTLPQGLTLQPNGVITGTPTTAGSATFTVELYDPTNGTRTTKQFTIAITAPAQFTVTFKSNYSGSALSDTTQVSAGATNLTLNSFQRTGYVFAGWATSDNGPVVYVDGESFPFTSNTNLFARWASVVTFNYNGGTGTPASTNVLEGTSVSLPTGSRSGFSQLGWELSNAPGALVANPFTPAGAVTLVASWSNALTLTYDSNFGTPTTQTQAATAGNVALQANAFVRNNYSFAGWATSRTGAVVHQDSATINVTQNTTLFARWNSLVTYDYNGGSGSTATNLVLDGDFVTLPTPNSRANFGFEGWTTQGAPSVLVANNYLPTGAITLVASWSPSIVVNNSFTITFDGNFASSGQQTQVGSAGAVTLATNSFVRPGFTFGGWATSPTGPVVHQDGAQIQLSANLTLYAVWTEVPGFVVTYHPGFTGVANVTQSIPVSGNLLALPFSLDGFLFQGWATTPGGRVIYTDGQAITLTGNLDLYAIWVERAPALDPYRVTYTSLGADSGRWPDRQTSPSKFFHVVRDNISLVKQGYRFGGWFNFANPSTTYQVGERIFVETNLRLAPIWLEVSRVRFTDQLATQGTAPAALEGLVGEVVTVPTGQNLRRQGFNFIGWRNNLVQPPVDYLPGASFALPSGGIVLDPVWEVVTKYEIVLDPGNGEPIRTVLLDPNDPALPLTPPTRDGYKFEGWFDAETGLLVPGPVEPNSNRRLIGRWIQLITITLDFNGVAPGIQELQYVPGGPAITPPTPARPGYNFTGWLVGPSFEERLNGPLTPSGNVTLKAAWELITFKVTLQHFSDPGMDVVLEYQPGGAALQLPRWVRQSFQFRGWTPSETGLTPFFGAFVPTDDSELYTSWQLKRTLIFTGDSSRITPTATRILNEVASLLRGANQTLHISTVGWVKETANKNIDARLSRDRALQTNAFLRRNLTFESARAVGRGIFGIDSWVSRRAELTVTVTGIRLK